MRISVWRSDVCSSDLAQLLIPKLFSHEASTCSACCSLLTRPLTRQYLRQDSSLCLLNSRQCCSLTGCVERAVKANNTGVVKSNPITRKTEAACVLKTCERIVGCQAPPESRYSSVANVVSAAVEEGQAGVTSDHLSEP